MNRYLPIGVALVVMAAAGLLQGLWSERWGSFPELETYAAQMKRVPKDVGQWSGQDLADDEKVMAAAGAVGHLSRIYSRPDGQKVSVFLVCGRVQDMNFHTPDRCYPANGFDAGSDEPDQRQIELSTNETAQFKTQTFTKSETTGESKQRVFWSFCGSNKWEAPDEHKWAFAGRRALYKIYVMTDVNGEAAAVEFIREFMPLLNQAFAPALQATPEATKVAKS